MRETALHEKTGRGDPIPTPRQLASFGGLIAAVAVTISPLGDRLLSNQSDNSKNAIENGNRQRRIAFLTRRVEQDLDALAGALTEEFGDRTAMYRLTNLVSEIIRKKAIR